MYVVITRRSTDFSTNTEGVRRTAQELSTDSTRSGKETKRFPLVNRQPNTQTIFLGFNKGTTGTDRHVRGSGGFSVPVCFRKPTDPDRFYCKKTQKRSMFTACFCRFTTLTPPYSRAKIQGRGTRRRTELTQGDNFRVSDQNRNQV